jgi:hypothetical protein
MVSAALFCWAARQPGPSEMTGEKEPIDPEVREVMEDQERLARGVGRESAKKERTLRRLS